jgi:type I restriction enzyme R subunit
VQGLLKDRLAEAREDLEEAREAVKALCEPVEAPREELDYFHWFCAKESGNARQLKDNEPKRVKLYKFVGALLRSYASIANEVAAAGYRIDEIEQIKDEVDHFAKVSATVKRNSGDYIDLKAFEPAMRHLIDTYIRAQESEIISDFDDLSLIALIVERGPEAVDALPKGLRKSEGAVAETIENNVRRIIVNETPVDPAYYEKMSKLLDALIEQRRKGMLTYKDYLEKIAKLTRDATLPGGGPGGYPPNVKTAAQRALYNNLGQNEGLTLAVDAAIEASRMDGWRDSTMKAKRVRLAIRTALQQAHAAAQAPDGLDDGDGRDSYAIEAEATRLLELAKHQSDY